jgi:hypothetical protein
MRGTHIILPGYLILSGVAVVMFLLAVVASREGWGLTSDAQALAQARGNSGGSVRSGSLHSRRYRGGGPGYGK